MNKPEIIVRLILSIAFSYGLWVLMDPLGAAHPRVVGAIAIAAGFAAGFFIGPKNVN